MTSYDAAMGTTRSHVMIQTAEPLVQKLVKNACTEVCCAHLAAEEGVLGREGDVVGALVLVCGAFHAPGTHNHVIQAAVFQRHLSAPLLDQDAAKQVQHRCAASAILHCSNLNLKFKLELKDLVPKKTGTLSKQECRV